MQRIVFLPLAVCISGFTAFPRPLLAQDIAQLERDCEAGHGRACCNLGKEYEGGIYGHGVVDQDYERAASLYQKSCDLNDVNGCDAGARLHGHTGSLPDSVKSAAFMQQGCDLGYGLACLKLGLMYDVGFRVPQDTARANVLFKKGCMFENEEACKLIRR